MRPCRSLGRRRCFVQHRRATSSWARWQRWSTSSGAGKPGAGRILVNEKIQAIHLDRRATVYLRQSTLKQVCEHRESTARQYALKDRAIALGWPKEQVEVIDEDLGQSGG